ncbi:MAG: hypothetical protein CO144_00915 [Candidatus Nealsonbacteria bacterium CG_4_9_14_3_um_filter_35_11]|uniref:ECF transporter S component n=2 Tax=Candidatus Nealsoniibacteriota TaxID=1817911 RepID=A0A2M7DBB9_9BACT|nr:MAG: hypothetical protein COV62_00525 [Candidatus Nealsonbacteria bacterium CG11_big_fil_rev_8_21_14_0_20_35_11]PIV45751.1 MAG: hypothetical protein COS24_00565 [Candidatus Nealsonbacteria bacterium CG02_land_8_20_14_3_00_34_20]PIW92690.1 MAG: hypothetical protein COZ88_00865 [Candidatus Nealsonbacteria bacterium CG_4_8_14_3_um_filter_34_13]PJA84684.1 MAG: hypothetical protein CO144_00915 [Candidatus Nealsonbacteria bacterium CG_4_9_14_3_um_filter_35_11]
MHRKKIILAILIVILGVIFRIFLVEIINIPNFEAVTALSLLSGSFFGGIYTAIIPLSIIFVSDFHFGNTSIYFFTWSAFILIGILGTLIKANSSYYIFKITGMGFLSTLFFYLWTNFGWWLTFGMYEMTVGGLMQCYIAALPFLKNQIFSVLIFVPSFAILLSFAFSKIKVPQKDIKIKLAKEEMRS